MIFEHHPRHFNPFTSNVDLTDSETEGSVDPFKPVSNPLLGCFIVIDCRGITVCLFKNKPKKSIGFWEGTHDTRGEYEWGGKDHCRE